MLFSSLALILGLGALALAQDTCLTTVKKAFDDANIPADLTLSFDPKFLLEVTFPETDHRYIRLRAGVQLPINATTGPPIFSVKGKAGRGPFIVAIIDPDAMNPQIPPTFQVRQSLGANFLRNSPKLPFLLRNTTPAITEYIPPEPPAGSVPHRYVFLLFNQPRHFNNQTLVTSTTPVLPFNISQFAHEANLGDPIGGTFMLVGPEASSS